MEVTLKEIADLLVAHAELLGAKTLLPPNQVLIASQSVKK